MQLADLVAATADVAATRARKEKTGRLAELLRTASDEEIEVVVGVLAGDPRQGRIGVGWATVGAIATDAASTPTLTVADLDRLLSEVANTHGEGSQSAREHLLVEFLGRATSAESDFVRRLLIGELRQGANAGLVTDAVAKATGVPAAVLRRAVMLSGDLGAAATIARRSGRAGLDAVGLELGRPIQPMLASTSPDVATAVEELRRVSVEWKLDGVRIQVHKRGAEVRIWTRNLNDVTERLPEAVDVILSMPAERLVLDGEVLGVGDDGSPAAFQDTVSNEGAVVPFFFDLLHRDGVDLLDEPLTTRLEHLDEVTGAHRIPGIVTDDSDDAATVLEEALARGHEGVMIKAAESTYQAGRRGKTWRKVKPVHTLDLVVLAVEQGSGRRRGWLSNIHLGAREPEAGFVMVGKTFKGMTDQMLEWQTQRFRDLTTHQDGHVVYVRPEQVVEIALDGVQRSTRYPGGVALRFARVVRYRDDKPPSEADTIASVRSLL